VTRVSQEYFDARREEILGAAARLFARKGISGATMAEIAKEADLSAGAIYRYFSSKEDLLRAVFDDAVTRNQQMFAEASRTAGSPTAALIQIGRANWIGPTDRDDFICDLQMELSAAQDPDVFGIDLRQSRDEVKRLLQQLVEEAIEQGELDASIDPEQLAVLLLACTSGIKMQKLSLGEEFDTEGAFNLLVRMVRGLAPSSSTQQGS
jgi:AcrR family transcriptional regulator